MNNTKYSLIPHICYSGKKDCHKADIDKESLDLYLPEGIDVQHILDSDTDSKPSILKRKEEVTLTVPLVIFVHGGGWRRGDRTVWKHFLSCWDTNILLALFSWFFNLYGNVGECLATSGIACAVVSYPLVKIHMPLILWEKMTSFLAGSGTCTMICGTALYLGGFTDINMMEFGLLSSIKLGCCLYSAVVILLLTIRYTAYRMTVKDLKIMWMSSAVVTFSIMTLFSDPFFYLSLFSTTFTQLLLLYKRLNAPPITHSDQITAVKNVIKWCDKLCDKSKYFNDICLMGHSAGGHMVTLISLDPRNHCERIKGVISVSGVYDLNGLSSGLLKHVYLYPVFGTDPSIWQAFSPMHLARNTELSDARKPAYLLANAAQDMHLIEDTKELCNVFARINISNRQIVVKGKNHFTIMNLFTQYNKEHHLVKSCLEFIKGLKSDPNTGNYIF